MQPNAVMDNTALAPEWGISMEQTASTGLHGLGLPFAPLGAQLSSVPPKQQM